MKTTAIVLAIICSLMMTINAVFMVFSPRAWFRLPSWIRASGVLTKEKYSEGGRSVLVRMIGAIILILVGGVVFDLIVENIQR